MTLRCILTGFDAFGESAENFSQLAVERLGSQVRLDSGQSVTLDKMILATSGDQCWAALRESLDGLGDDQAFVIMTGMASKRHLIGLERFGLNILDYRIPDN